MQNRQENENSQALPQDVMKELKSFAAAVQKRVEKFPPESDLEKIKKQFAQAIFQEKRSRESFSEMFFNIIADIYIDNDKRLRQMQRLVAIASGIEAVNPPGKLPNLTEFKEKYPNLPIQSIMQYVNISHPFPSLMNTRNTVGSTPLIIAAYNGQAEIVKCLLDGKADINAKNKTGQTALMAGAASENIVKLLLERGADPSHVNNAKMTALHLVKGSPENAKLLIDAKADLNAQDKNGFTPLFYAQTSSHPKSSLCVKILLAAGANPMLTNKEGQSPFKFELFAKTKAHDARVIEVKITNKLTK